jgi:predicted chitinase
MAENVNFDELNSALNDASRSLSDFKTGVTRSSQSTGILSNAQAQASQAVKRESDLRAKNNKILVDASKSMASAMGGLAKGLASGNTSFTQLNTIIDITSKAVGGLASSIPYVGKALNAAAQATGEAAKIMVQQFEEGWKAFRAVADSGVVSSFTELKQLGDATGMRFENINETLGKYSGSLARLGGTTVEGAKRFQAIAAGSEKIRDEFYQLGINAKEFTEFQLKYIDQQTKTGMAQGKTDKQLIAGSVKYIEELDTLSKLTGASRKELQSQRDQALSESRFAAATMLLGEEVQKTALSLNDILIKRGGPAFAQGIRDMMSGNITTDAAKQVMLQTGNRAGEIVEQVRAGTLSATDAYNKIISSIDPTFLAQFSQNVGDNALITKDFAQALKLASGGLITKEQLEKIEADRKAVKEGQDAHTTSMANATKSLEKTSKDFQQLATDSRMVSSAVKAVATQMENFTSWARKTMGVPNPEESKAKAQAQAQNRPGTVAITPAEAKKAREIAEQQAKELRDKSNKSGKRKDRLAAQMAEREVVKARIAESQAGGGGGSAAPAPSGGAAPASSGGASAPAASETTPSAKPPQDQNVKENLTEISKALRKAGVTDDNYLKAVLGNVMKESGGKMVGEQMDYSNTSNDRIRKIFGDRVKGKSDEEINKMKATKESWAEAMYGHGTVEGRGMGNVEPGDGWKYRGRGFIQLTGKKQYADASAAIFGDDRLVKNPEMVNHPSVAAEVVAWYMTRSKERVQSNMGFGKGPLTPEQAALLTTSQIAGSDVRKKHNEDYRNEILGKVTSNAANMGEYVGVRQGRTGGIFRGPSTGYPVMLHGEEAVIPANSSMGKQVLNSSGGYSGSETNRLLASMLGRIGERFDEMISLLDTSAGNHRKMLQTMY